MGIILTENTMKHLKDAPPDADVKSVVFKAASEVGGAIITAVSTTIVSFLPVFTMVAAEGKLFKPLAYTKTFALASSIIAALTIIPSMAHILFAKRNRTSSKLPWGAFITIVSGILILSKLPWWIGTIVIIVGCRFIAERYLSETWKKRLPLIVNGVVIVIIGILLTTEWLPLSAERPFISNLLFVTLLAGGLTLIFRLFEYYYSSMLSWFLDRKPLFIVPVLLLVITGACIWLGFSKVFFFLPDAIRKTSPVTFLAHSFPGLGKEFMPPLDEGSFLYMPTTMSHASQGASQEIVRQQDIAIKQIPEVETVVGKIGRVDSPLDPAPMSMFETIITVKPEYIVNENGNRELFRYNKRSKEFVLDKEGNLIPDKNGRPFRQWRPQIRRMDDIWDQIVKAAEAPGLPVLQNSSLLQHGLSCCRVV